MKEIIELSVLCYPLFCVTFLWWLYGVRKEVNDIFKKILVYLYFE